MWACGFSESLIAILYLYGVRSGLVGKVLLSLLVGTKSLAICTELHMSVETTQDLVRGDSDKFGDKMVGGYRGRFHEEGTETRTSRRPLSTPPPSPTGATSVPLTSEQIV